MLKLINVNFEYHENRLLNNINFELPPGGLLHVCGANGSGKTTLLRLIAGLFEVRSGEIQFNQQEILFIGHKSGLHPHLTVRENIQFDLYNNDSIMLINLLKTYDLEGLASQFPGQLSAGQQRRVALLRLHLSKASLWLLDEPFTALDEKNITRLVNSIQKHRKSGGAVILSSHQKLPEELGQYQEYQL